MVGYEQDATIVMNAIPGVTTGITTLISGFASINQQFQNITNGIADGFGLVDAAIISTGALVVKLGIDAAQAYGQFEQGMRIVEVVSGQTGSAIEQLSQKANEFSVQYRTDINQITEGLQTLGRAGLKSADEQTQVLQNGLQTAKLEGRQLNQVLEEVLQNTTLLGGDLRSPEFGEQSTYVNDLLVATSMTAPITSHDISQTLQYSGGLAATAGANINSEEGKEILTDYMATIAAFAQKGVKGSLAGTALRAFLNKPATQDSSVLEGLGMIKLKPEYLWEDDGNTMKPISDQIALIQRQMDKLNVSQMDRLQIWSKILGGKMGQQMMKLQSEDIKELTSDIDSATASQELANKSMNTFSQNLKQIEEQGQVVFRGIGEHIVKLVNPLLPIIQKITELFSNPIATFGIFAGGLALVVNAAQRLWGVIKAVKDEFALMRVMATEALQAITAQSTAASASISTLGNIMIGGKAGGLTAETNKIAILNEGLIRTKGLIADIQMQSLGLAGGTKLLPGHRYGEGVRSSVVGQETRSIEVMNGDSPETIHQLRQFHVFDTKDADEFAKSKRMINAVAAQRYNEYINSVKNPNPNLDERYFRQKVYDEVRFVGQDGRFAYMRGPWSNFNPNDALFNEQEKYAWAMANARSGEPTPLISDEQKAAEEARANAEKELERRKNLGFRGRLKEDLGKKLTEFEEQGQPYVDKIMSPFRKLKNGLKSTAESFGNMSLPFQDGIGAFQDFKNKKSSYLTKADLNYLIDKGHLPSFWKDSDMTTKDMNKAARGYWAAQENPNARADAMGDLYNGMYRQTIGRTLSNLRNRLGEIYRTPFKDLIKLPSRSSLEGLGGRLQKNLEKNFTGLGNSIRRGISSLNNFTNRLNQARGAITSLPSQINIGERLRKNLEKGFSGLGNSIRAFVGRVKDSEDTMKTLPVTIKNTVSNIGPAIKERVASLGTSFQELGIKAVEAARRLGNLSMADIVGAAKGFSLSQAIGGAASRMVSSGAGILTKGIGLLGKGVAGTVGALGTFTNYLGGPVMVAMMAFSAITSFVSSKMQEFSEEMNNVKEDLKNAYSERKQAESQLRADYAEQNPDAEETDIENMVLAHYEQMAKDIGDQKTWVKKISESSALQPEYEYDEEKDDGSLKEKEDERDDETKLQESIDENTAALYNATAKIMLALDKAVLKMNDSFWGLDGLFSTFSDNLGHFVGTWGGLSEGNSFTESGGFLLSSSQKDSNYPGYTEMAGLFLEDSFDAEGSLKGTVDRMFGTDSWKVLGSMNQDSKEFLQSMSQFSRGLGRASNSRLQASMMNDKKTWQSLGKEVAKYERKNKKAVGTQETKNSRMENLIKKLQIDTGLSRIQVLQASYLQQMQDMYSIAEQVMVPLITQNATAAANTLILGQQTIAPLSNDTSGNTYSTAAIASNIAAMLSTIAWAKSAEATQNAAKMDPNNPLHELAMNSKDPDEFLNEAIKMEEGSDYGGIIRGIGWLGETVLDARLGGNGIGSRSLTQTIFGENSMEAVYEKLGITPLSKQKLLIGGGDTTGTDTILNTFGGLTYSTLYPGMSMEEANKKAGEDIKDLRALGENYTDIYSWFGKMWGSNEMGEKILDAYLSSGIGEPEESGGGSGSGSGSGDKDNNQGTRKERVDLVLCSKKEIPKLNVNLFKKPPTFTVLNKNFKVRDVKINTEDTPKAIMSAIKNSFIDVQKRSDPKIIQDEEGVYNPADATEGNPLPSGTAKTRTD